MPGGPGVATGTERATLLVVADEPATRELLTTSLQGLPYTVQHARDGAGTLAAVAAASPDLVLLDVVLPDLDGYDVLQRLRADPRTATIPIVLLTERTDQTERLRALEAGADDFLIKPIDCAELLARARTLLRLKRLRDTHEAEVVRWRDAAWAAERGWLELQRQQAQKLEAAGRLASGIAHDFNNFLAALNGYTEMLLQELPLDDPRRLYAEEVRRAGERGARLTQQLLRLRQLLDAPALAPPPTG